MRKDVSEFRTIGQQKIQELRELQTPQLRAAAGNVEILLSGGRKAEFSVIVEEVDDRTIQVVVQGFLAARFFRFFKHVFVAGFQKDDQGHLRELRNEELYAYD